MSAVKDPFRPNPDVRVNFAMVQAANESLSEAGIADKIGVVVADSGHLSDSNLTIKGGPEVLIAWRCTRMSAGVFEQRFASGT